MRFKDPENLELPLLRAGYNHNMPLFSCPVQCFPVPPAVTSLPSFICPDWTVSSLFSWLSVFQCFILHGLFCEQNSLQPLRSWSPAIWQALCFAVQADLTSSFRLPSPTFLFPCSCYCLIDNKVNWYYTLLLVLLFLKQFQFCCSICSFMSDFFAALQTAACQASLHCLLVCSSCVR